MKHRFPPEEKLLGAILLLSKSMDSPCLESQRIALPPSSTAVGNGCSGARRYPNVQYAHNHRFDIFRDGIRPTSIVVRATDGETSTMKVDDDRICNMLRGIATRVGSERSLVAARYIKYKVAMALVKSSMPESNWRFEESRRWIARVVAPAAPHYGAALAIERQFSEKMKNSNSRAIVFDEYVCSMYRL